MLFSPLSDQVLAAVCNPTRSQDIFEVETMTSVKKVHDRYCLVVVLCLLDGSFPVFQLSKVKTLIRHAFVHQFCNY